MIVLIRFVDSRTGTEIGTCSDIEVALDKMTDVTTFSSSSTQLSPARGDVEIQVNNFKTPQPILQNSPMAREQTAALNKIIAALVRAMGGAVTLTDLELSSIDGTTLSVEQTSERGMIMRIEE